MSSTMPPGERICRQFTETLEFIRIHEEQRARGRAATSNPTHRATIDRLTAARPELETTAQDSRAAARMIRTGPIDRILAMDDAELGRAVLAGQGFPGRDP